MDGVDTGTVKAKDVGTYDLYYRAVILTPLGQGDDTCGNTERQYEFSGHSVMKILRVDAYVIAPSASIREDDGKIIVNGDPNNSEDRGVGYCNIIITSDDIKLVGILSDDVENKFISLDGETEMPKTTLDKEGQTTIKARIAFKDADAALKNYNLQYIDGSLMVYSKDSSTHEHEGY